MRRRGRSDLVGKIVIPGTVNVGQGSLAPIGGDVITVLDANTGAARHSQRQ